MTTHPSDCKDCEEIKNSDHGSVNIMANGKQELRHGESCNECVRMYGKSRLHYSIYGLPSQQRNV